MASASVKTLLCLTFALLMTACATEQAQPTTEEPTAASALGINPCELLGPAEIEAAQFRQFPVGNGVQERDVHFGLAKADLCTWNIIGDPYKFRLELVRLYVFRIQPGQSPEEVFEAHRMLGSIELTDIGDQAVYGELVESSLLVRAGEFLFHIDVTITQLGPAGAQEKLVGLARLVLERR